MLDHPDPLLPAASSPDAVAKAAAWAERAQRIGAWSRGPPSAAGRQASSRNALRHRLCAKVHLVVPGGDEAAFTGLVAAWWTSWRRPVS